MNFEEIIVLLLINNIYIFYISETNKLMVIVSPDRRISYLSTGNKFTICLTGKKKRKKVRASISLWHGSLRELIHINIAAILESIALNLGRGSYANSLTNDYKTEDS